MNSAAVPASVLIAHAPSVAFIKVAACVIRNTRLLGHVLAMTTLCVDMVSFSHVFALTPFVLTSVCYATCARLQIFASLFRSDNFVDMLGQRVCIHICTTCYSRAHRDVRRLCSRALMEGSTTYICAGSSGVRRRRQRRPSRSPFPARVSCSGAGEWPASGELLQASTLPSARACSEYI